jgi:hypothetical protein
MTTPAHPARMLFVSVPVALTRLLHCANCDGGRGTGPAIGSASNQQPRYGNASHSDSFRRCPSMTPTHPQWGFQVTTPTP